jgi:hypothetical protein
MAQIGIAGHIFNPNNLAGALEFLELSSTFPSNCHPHLVGLTPDMVPGYALSYDPKACGGLSRFVPVNYREWLLARTVPIYIVNTVKPENAQKSSVTLE